MVVPNYKLIGFLLGFFLIVCNLGNVCYAQEITPTPTDSVSYTDRIYQEYCENLDFALNVLSYTVSSVFDSSVVTLSNIQESFLNALNRRYNNTFGTRFKENNVLNDWFSTNIVYNIENDTYNASNEFIEIEKEVVDEIAQDHGIYYFYTGRPSDFVSMFPSQNVYNAFVNLVGSSSSFLTVPSSRVPYYCFSYPLESSSIENNFVFIMNTSGIDTNGNVAYVNLFDKTNGETLLGRERFSYDSTLLSYSFDLEDSLANYRLALRTSPVGYFNQNISNLLIKSTNSRVLVYNSFSDYMLYANRGAPILQGGNTNNSFNTSNIDNSVTYGDVINYYGDINNVTADQIGDYIDNSNNSTNNGSSGDNNGGNGASGILDALSGFMDFIGRLIGILVNGITSLLESLVDTFESIVNFIPSIFNNYLSTLFDWLPDSIINLITLSISLGVIIFIIKFIRG